MKVSSYSEYKTNFKGRMPIIADANMAAEIKHIANCRAGQIVERLTSRIKENIRINPKAANYLIGDNLPTKPNTLNDLLGSFIDIVKMPLSVTANFASYLHEKFPDSEVFNKLCKANLIKKQISTSTIKKDIGTLRGLYQKGEELIKATEKGLENCECGIDGNHCLALSKGLDNALNDSMDFAKATYDTKHERFVARLVSGFTAAAFLGKDFFNKAKMSGKSDKEANKDKNEKVKQEVIANIGEAVSQFSLIATVPILVNTKSWVAPIFSAGVGFIFNIVSRLIVKRPLKRIKPPLKSPLLNQIKNKPMNIEEFKNRSLKGSLKDNSIYNPAIYKENSNKPKKKSMLSLKNILIASAASVVGGFALRYGKIKLTDTNVYKNLKETFGNSMLGKKFAKFKANEIEEIFTNEKEIKEIKDMFNSIGEKGVVDDLTQKATKLFKNATGKNVLIGSKYKTTQLLGKIEVPVVELHKALLAPIELVKNIIGFPYKRILSLAEAQGWVKKAASQNKINDQYKIRNIITKYREYKDLYGNDNIKFHAKFKEYVQKTHEYSLNTTSSSKISNEKIAVPAQVLGMLLGITFNMNDDYNKTIEHGDSIEEAEKAARLRGLNKFARVGVQAAVVSVLNSTFKKQYNMNLIAAGAITAVATVLTDVACRILTGMPFNQMTKEEQEAYKKEQEKGISGKYFKFIDKLAG